MTPWLDGYLTFLASLESDSRRRAAIERLRQTYPKEAQQLQDAWEKKKGKL